MALKRLILNRKCSLPRCRVVGVDEVWTQNCKAEKGGNAGVMRQRDAGKCYHVTHHYWQAHSLCSDLTNQLSPRHKPSLTPLWMTVCWFCSLLFTSVEFAHQRKLSTQKYSRWTQKEWENTVKCQLREKFVLCTQEFVKGFVQAKGNYIYELQLIHTRREVTQDLLCSS